MTLQELKQKILTSTLSQAEALEFFNLLFDDSLIRCQKTCPDYSEYFPTDQYGKGWKEGTPTGVIDHHTASSNAKSALQWFSSYDKWPKIDPKTGKEVKGRGNASSAFVIDTNGDIYCLIRFWEGHYDWHEPQVVKQCLGIEQVSCGPLKLDSATNKFKWWPNNWTSDYPLANILPPVKLSTPYRGIEYFQPYTREQVLSNIIVKRALVALYPNRMRKEMFMDHATLRADKFDMGPVWPLDLLREVAFGSEPISSHPELMTFTRNPSSPLDAIDAVDLKSLVKDKQYHLYFETQLSGEEIDRQKIQQQLSKLGFNVNTDGHITAQYDQAVRQFQSTHGLKADGIVGPLTITALEAASKSR